MTLKRIRFIVDVEFEDREAAPEFPPRETHVERSKWEEVGRRRSLYCPICSPRSGTCPD